MSEKIYLSTSEDASNKMDKTNPSGTGTFSIDRAGSTTGARSFAFQGEASGDDSIAIGSSTIAKATNSVVIGSNSAAYIQASNGIAIGENVRSGHNKGIAIGSGVSTGPQGSSSVIIGYDSNGPGTQTVKLGHNNIGSSDYSIAIGANCNNMNTYSFLFGSNLISHPRCTTTGMYNSSVSDARFAVSNGSSTDARSNCFRVTDTAVYAKGNYNASGADYAEMFEWADGNPNDEDRVGRFVTLDGEMISLAESEDVFILGIVSAAPSVCGDAASEDWQGRFKRDIFGRMLFEDIEIPAEIDEETGEEKIPAHTINWYAQNDDWDNKQEYTARENRKEWDAVGLLGKLIMIDDGTAEVNGWVTAGEGGIAVKSDVKTKYRVMSRIDETHIKILIL
ncbi:MAG: hypothetical protein HFE90_08375 [Firmicutes bacterium]|nr:hypothetical protein [Bacillota bacterium]